MNRRRVSVAAATVLAFGALVVAPAAGWLTPHVGSGSATVADRGSGLVVTSIAAGGLHPGKTVAASVSITNSGSTDAIVTAITTSAAVAVGECPADIVTGTPRLDAAGLVQTDGVTRAIAAGASGVFALDVVMDAAAPVECAGATFELPVAVAGAQP